MGNILYSYKKIDGKTIIIRELKGDISAIELIDSFKYLIKNKITEDCAGILTDTTNAQFRFSIREFSRIIHFLKRSKELKWVKLAVLVSTPEKTIFPLIVGKKIPFIKIRPFNGKEAAFSWILN